ncbi:MAG: hypothetical protein GXY74_10415 [Phycisphaerae bacterium]|nr:hypothetical protein [Phycisphaerae bacterium]
MSGKNRASGLGFLRTLAICSVVVAGLGVGAVVVQHMLRPPAAESSGPAAASAPSSPADVSTDSARAAARPSATPTNRTSSGTMPSRTAAGTPATTPMPVAARRDTDDAPARRPGDAGEATRDAGARAPAARAGRAVPRAETHRWDERTGELVIGNRRFLATAARLRGLPLAQPQKEALAEFEATFQAGADQRLAQVEANLASTAAAYEQAEHAKDDDGAANYVDEHGRLIAQRDEILDDLERQYQDGVKTIVPEANRPRED